MFISSPRQYEEIRSYELRVVKAKQEREREREANTATVAKSTEGKKRRRACWDSRDELLSIHLPGVALWANLGPMDLQQITLCSSKLGSCSAAINSIRVAAYLSPSQLAPTQTLCMLRETRATEIHFSTTLQINNVYLSVHFTSNRGQEFYPGAKTRPCA